MKSGRAAMWPAGPSALFADPHVLRLLCSIPYYIVLVH
jgi:hypothetical protein